MLTIITRELSRSIEQCELTHVERQPIDFIKAATEHANYCALLEDLGHRVVVLPAIENQPDAVFVEDAAFVVNEVAVTATMGAEARRAETEFMHQTLQQYREVVVLPPPATLDGGDILQVGRTIYVGTSTRTNQAGAEELQKVVAIWDYKVVPIVTESCLHLKTAITSLGNNTILLNPDWFDASLLPDSDVIEVDPSEPFGANVLRVGKTLVYPAAFEKTRARIEAKGFDVRTVDISELQKAEAGPTCLSIVMCTLE